jgi:hypothetical protein
MMGIDSMPWAMAGMVQALKADPVGWYTANKLNPAPLAAKQLDRASERFPHVFSHVSLADSAWNLTERNKPATVQMLSLDLREADYFSMAPRPLISPRGVEGDRENL